MSLFRPSSSALARRLCTAKVRFETPPASPILALLLPRQRSHQFYRSFSSSYSLFATVTDPPPASPAAYQHPKRTVRIGQLPNGQVSESTINRIFGRKLSFVEGNNVLRILHHRRTAGSLADYGVEKLGAHYTHVTPDMALKGLQWLREKYPLDEGHAAESWAEREANRISYELWLADPDTDSKYKDPARAFREQMQKEEKEKEEHESETRKIGILHAGKSQFELHFEEKRRERVAEATAKAEEKEAHERDMEAKLATGEWVKTPSGKQLMRPGETVYLDMFGQEQIDRRKELNEKYRNLSTLSTAKTRDELSSMMTLTQRLYPMTAFVLLVVLTSFGFAHYYIPPAPEYRLFPSLSFTTATMVTIIGLNCLVALCWRSRALWPFMTRYFMNVHALPRAVQALTNIFSHLHVEHLITNMLYLGLAGPFCHELVGRGTFMGTYLSAGALGSLVSLYWHNVGRGDITAHSVGASAAIWGIASLYLLLTEDEVVKIPFFAALQYPFWPKMLFLAFVLAELRLALGKRRGMSDHASHFGGILVGAGTAGYLRATGFHEKKRELRESGTSQEGGQGLENVDKKTLDVGAMASQGLSEVKGGVLDVVKK